MGLISRVSSRTYRNQFFTLQPTTLKMAEGRLYVRGIFTGFRGGLKQQHENPAIVKLEGVNDKEGCQWYLGKRVAFVYKSEKNLKVVSGEKTRSRVIWGKIMRPHGHSGNVRVKFNKNMPCTARGKKVRSCSTKPLEEVGKHDEK